MGSFRADGCPTAACAVCGVTIADCVTDCRVTEDCAVGDGAAFSRVFCGLAFDCPAGFAFPFVWDAASRFRRRLCSFA
ncbi:MAG: hypothetical protein PT954_08465 [Eubacteriales bacterium]|nr:hypothetical protein [Eubacteriales bacterium]